MKKIVRAGVEAIIAILLTLAVVVGAFSAMFGFDQLILLSGDYYVAWAVILLVTHLAFFRSRRHIRLAFGVGVSVAVMAAHLVAFLTGILDVDISLVPVILHDFGFALIALITLNIVHLVIFRRRPQNAPAPTVSERVDDIPAPEFLTAMEEHVEQARAKSA